MHEPQHRSAFISLLLLSSLLLVGGSLASAGESETAGDAYRVALEHQAAGRTAEAEKAFARVIAIDPEHRAARRALGFEEVDGYWLAGDDLLRAKGFVHHGGRWMTAAEFADATRPERESRAQQKATKRTLGILAMVASADEAKVREGKRLLPTVPAEHRLEPLAKALRCEPASLRVYVAGELGKLRDPLAVPALLVRAIDDPVEEVRSAAADALRAIGAPDTIHPLGRALWSRDSVVRVRAAEAIGRIGDVAAAPYVVARWEKRSGDFSRVNLTTVRQLSFIQDFDVEVASTSFIADPIVGVLQEGIVHDVKVLATEQTFTTIERVAYAGALRRLSGEDHGEDVAAWRKWLQDR